MNNRQPNPVPRRFEAVITYSNSENGWMHLHSVYGCDYMGVTWRSAAHAWYMIVHGVNESDIKKGRLKTSTSTMSDQEKWNHLIGINMGKLELHPILNSFLLDLGDQDIIYSVSKFASHDQKWLGLTEPDQIGENKLGEAWMTIRDQIQNQKQ